MRKLDSTLSHEWLTTYLLWTRCLDDLDSSVDVPSSPVGSAARGRTLMEELAELGGTWATSSALFKV